MKNTIYTFLAGLIVGLSIMYFLKPAQVQKVAVETDKIPTVNSEPKQTESLALPKNTTKIEAKVVAKSDKVEVPVEESKQLTPETAAPVEAPPSSVTFQFDEQDLDALEQSLPDLQKEVSLYRRENGWLVRIHATTNPFAFIGIQDNDFIRDNQFQDLERDPSKKTLVGRLVDILTSLER